jgi:hypothetical protein
MSAVVRWSEFAAAAPELAAFGAERLVGPPAYLATLAGDGGVRVHPVTPIVSEHGLYVFMEATSPKGGDLRERRHFALHSAVPDTDGSGGEFLVRGEGRPVDDPAIRAEAVAAATYEPADRYVLFELLVGTARAQAYGDVRLPDPSRWQAG